MNRLPESTWKAIRHEYQTTKTTCIALAAKYGLNRETVSNRCKLEKWRHGRQERKRTRSQRTNQLVSQTSPHSLAERILSEAEQWLDRIQEAYEAELRYDRIEAIQKLLPQWKNAVDQVQKRGNDAPTRPLLSLDLKFLSGQPLPPRILPPTLEAEISALARTDQNALPASSA